MVRKVLTILFCLSFIFPGNIIKVEAADITEQGSNIQMQGAYAKWNGNWFDILSITVPNNMLYIDAMLFGYYSNGNSPDYDWSKSPIGGKNPFILFGSYEKFGKYKMAEPVKMRIFVDDELYSETELQSYVMRDSSGANGYHYALFVDVETMKIEKIFKSIKIQMKGVLLDTGESSSSSSSSSYRYARYKMRYTDEATARILGTSISAEEARRAAQEAREKAQEALNKAEQARLQAVAATDKAEQARLQALEASLRAEAARLQAVAAYQETLAIKSELNATRYSIEQKLQTNQTNMEKKINDLSQSINTDIKNITTNIHSYLPPSLTKVSGYNNATATTSNEFKVSLDYSNATEYRVKIGEYGSWSNWQGLALHDTLGYISVSGFNKGANSVTVEVRNTEDGPVAKGRMTVFSAN